MHYTLRTLLILLLLGPPALAELHVDCCRKVAGVLLPPLTSGWGVKPQAQTLCLAGITPPLIILEEDEEKLGINLAP